MPLFDPSELSPFVIICGHYGVGKTNLSLNIALDLARQGSRVVLADMDVVNPYFRSSDYRSLLEEAGVILDAPVFAGTTLDGPSLSGSLTTWIEEAQRAASAKEKAGFHLIVDAGGDDVGATALGRYSELIRGDEYQMLYVLNCYRNLTQTPSEACELLYEIERKSNLKASHLVSNAHMRDETTSEHVFKGIEFSREASRVLELPLLFSTVPQRLVSAEECFFPAEKTSSSARNHEMVYPVKMFVRTPWEQASDLF